MTAETTVFHCPITACDWSTSPDSVATVQDIVWLQRDITRHVESHDRHDLERALGRLQVSIEMLPDQRLVASEQRAAKNQSANDRAWALVQQWREEAAARGEDPYQCPHAQALANTLIDPQEQS